MQRLERILAQTAATKVPEWPSYNNFCKVTQNPHFLQKCKGGTKANFSKIAQKIALVLKAQKHSGANGITLKLVCTKTAKTGKHFLANSGSTSTRMAKLWQFLQGNQKPAFSEKVQTGDQGKKSENWNRQKSWIQDFSKLKSWIRPKSWLQVFGKLKS